MNIHTIFINSIFILTFISHGFAADTLFQDVAPSAGLQKETDRLQYGLAWGDFDRDGRLDLFVADNPQNQVFHNQGDGAFHEIGLAAGIQDADFIASGGAWGDYDNDGDVDLFIANMSAKDPETPVVNRLFRNNGDKTFTDVAETAGVTGHESQDHEHAALLPTQDDHEHDEPEGGFTSAAWADINRDGHLDLLVCNRYHGPFYYENQGDGTFHLATEEAGLILHSHFHDHDALKTAFPTQNEEKENIGVDHAALGDYDNDGDLDIFFSVALAHQHEHDHEDQADPRQEEPHAEETENRLFQNQGDGTFFDVTDDAGLGEPDAAVSHSSVWGDYDNDGYLDLFVCNLGSETKGTASPSRLYRNQGDGAFLDVTIQSGIEQEIYAFNAAWVDINLDGHLDLSLIYHPSHDDFPEGVLFKKPHPLYLNNGDGAFTNINKDSMQAVLETGVMDISHLIGLAWGDYDNDQDMDISLTENHGDGPIRLYQNQYGNNAVQQNQGITLAAKTSHSIGNNVGIRIALTTTQGTQIQDIGLGRSGFACQHPSLAYFGLGQETSANATVYWPDGTVETFAGLAAESTQTLRQGQGTTVAVSEWSLY